jgi:hypothetical protein
MYAKLYSRITESSLMEEPIPVRYTFMGLMAIADQSGHVIGTDVAIARRLNMPLEQFTEAINRLMAPDPHSNSKEVEGRRVVPSEGERGYRLVNYLTYRNIRDEAQRREYMRTYIKNYRDKGRDKSRPVNSGKPGLAQAEAASDADAESNDDSGVNGSSHRSQDETERITEDWLNGLAADPNYRNIDVRRELVTMQGWCRRHNKPQPTRRYFLNWLNMPDRTRAEPWNREIVLRDSTNPVTAPRPAPAPTPADDDDLPPDDD